MFDVLKSLFSNSRDDSGGGLALDPEDPRLAQAALMFHVIAADGVIREEELARMKVVLSEKFDLSDDEFDDLFAAAKEADRDAVDLYRFTSILKKQMNRDQRIAMVEQLWEMVFADGKMHEFEDNVVWRAAQLLEVETADRIAMKQRVRARNDDTETGDTSE